MSKVKTLDVGVEINLTYLVEETRWTTDQGIRYMIDLVRATYRPPEGGEDEYYELRVYGWRIKANNTVDRRQKERDRVYRNRRDTEEFVEALGIDYSAEVAKRYTHIAPEPPLDEPPITVYT